MKNIQRVGAKPDGTHGDSQCSGATAPLVLLSGTAWTGIVAANLCRRSGDRLARHRQSTIPASFPEPVDVDDRAGSKPAALSWTSGWCPKLGG